MKILITADVHFRQHWFRWLIEEGASYDLICIAGDLLDMFGSEPRIAQAREVSRWIRELAKVARVAICSGNHDNAGRQTSLDRAPVYEWLAALGKEPKIITDGMTELVNDLIVTTVPYHCSKEQKSVWLDRGNTIRRQRGSQWLVLQNVPPRGPIPVRPPRNARLWNFSRLTGRNISFAGTVISFRTLPETAGR